MMAALQRIVTMAGLATFRTFRSPATLFYLVLLPVLLGLSISGNFSSNLLRSQGEVAPVQGSVVADVGLLPAIIHDTPRGSVTVGELIVLRSVFGSYLLFACSTLLGRSGSLHAEREGGQLQRTLATGVPVREVVIGHVLSLVLIGLVQAALVFAISLALGTPWLAEGWAGLALPVIATLFAFVGLGVGVSGITKNGAQARIITGAAPMLLVNLGGVFWPIEAAPQAFRKFALANPFHWAMEAFRGSFVYAGLSTQTVPFVALGLIGVLGIVVGTQGLRRMRV